MKQPSPLIFLRAKLKVLHDVLRGEYWFPHVPLAVFMALGGLWLLQIDLGANWDTYVHAMLKADFSVINPAALPALLIGGGMIIMAFALLWRSRIAWAMAMLLAVTAGISTMFATQGHPWALVGYFIVLVLLLLSGWRHFDRSSVAASTIFALTLLVMLMVYATFGAYYLGHEFDPPITDLVTALYFSMVTMSTVGYGDISPSTPDSRLFTISVIVLGLTVFATSITAVIGPLVSHSLRRIVDHKDANMKREQHFIVIGSTTLAINTWRQLAKRGFQVTRILRQPPEEGELEDVDVIVGEPSDKEVLERAGVVKAQAVLAMSSDDSENAFAILAVKEMTSDVRTVAAVNDTAQRARIDLAQPDVVIAPEVLGGELMAMLLSGEELTPDFVLKRVFQERD